MTRLLTPLELQYPSIVHLLSLARQPPTSHSALYCGLSLHIEYERSVVCVCVLGEIVVCVCVCVCDEWWIEQALELKDHHPQQQQISPINYNRCAGDAIYDDMITVGVVLYELGFRVLQIEDVVTDFLRYFQSIVGLPLVRRDRFSFDSDSRRSLVVRILHRSESVKNWIDSVSSTEITFIFKIGRVSLAEIYWKYSLNRQALTLLTHKNKAYVWGDKQVKLSQILKENNYVNAPVLATPPNGPPTLSVIVMHLKQVLGAADCSGQYRKCIYDLRDCIGGGMKRDMLNYNDREFSKDYTNEDSVAETMVCQASIITDVDGQFTSNLWQGFSESVGYEIDPEEAYNLSQLIGPEIMQETTEKIVQIKERLKTASGSRPKRYADKRPAGCEEAKAKKNPMVNVVGSSSARSVIPGNMKSNSDEIFDPFLYFLKCNNLSLEDKAFYQRRL
ncbi:hypothetical protein Tco_1523619 [Tanacetum coccineum]